MHPPPPPDEGFVQNLALSATAWPQEATELEVATGIALERGRISAPVEVEYGITDALEVSLGASVGVSVGVSAGVPAAMDDEGLTLEPELGAGWAFLRDETGGLALALEVGLKEAGAIELTPALRGWRMFGRLQLSAEVAAPVTERVVAARGALAAMWILGAWAPVLEIGGEAGPEGRALACAPGLALHPHAEWEVAVAARLATDAPPGAQLTLSWGRRLAGEGETP